MHATPPSGGPYQNGVEKSTNHGPPLSRSSFRKDTSDVPHFAARARGGLAVKMDGGSGNFEPALEILYFAADEISHFHATVADRFGERPAGYRPDMLLELRHRGPIQRPMAGI